MMADQTYFGIDLGTTYSAISYVDESGKPTVVRNRVTSHETTPSVVYFENADNVVVGATAKNVARMYPDKVVQRVKRDMGKPREWEFNGRTHTPESISALILKDLAESAASQTHGEVRSVVITVPAYFGMLEREATTQAGRIAGLDVMGIVPEPVAAALQYEVKATDGERIVLVYDLGGGTFDTTAIRIGPDAIEVLCTDGDQELGGVDWDDRLINHLIGELQKAGPSQDPTDDAEFMQDLALQAEEIKRQLSQTESRTLPLRYGGASAMVEVSRPTFEKITEDLLDRTIEIVDRTLDKLGQKLGVSDPARRLHDVLLVGGSTKMPAVTARLQQKYGWSPLVHDPDLAVARGAAKFALSRAVWSWQGDTPPTPQQREARIEEISRKTGLGRRELEAMSAQQITTVLPKAFGVKLVDARQPGWESDPEGASYIEHLVHADEALPTGEKFLDARTVAPNQTAVEVMIYEQAGTVESRELSANKAVDHDSGLITGLPPLPVDSPIDIRMHVDENGKLHLTAVEPSTGKNLKIEVQVSVLSEAEVREAQRAISAMTVRA
jgi:molecular chaperone DnaK (HSP70)